MDKVDVLDKGYVRLVDKMGTDLTVANAARVSFLKRSEELTDGDRKLIGFLAREGHTSPFRHVILQFEIKAPLMVRSQWFKYRVGGNNLPPGFIEHPLEGEGTGNGDDGGFEDPLHARNEASRRYVSLDMDYYIPDLDQWRSKPANSKQGSGEVLPRSTGAMLSRKLEDCTIALQEAFEDALAMGVAPEQARLFLPAYALYATWYWTTSLQSVAHFLEQRLGHGAQNEITAYALAVYDLAKPLFPVSMDELIPRSEQA